MSIQGVRPLLATDRATPRARLQEVDLAVLRESVEGRLVSSRAVRRQVVRLSLYRVRTVKGRQQINTPDRRCPVFLRIVRRGLRTVARCLDHPTRSHSFTTVKEAPDTQRGPARNLPEPTLECLLSLAVISGSPVLSVLRRRHPEWTLPSAIRGRSQVV